MRKIKIGVKDVGIYLVGIIVAGVSIFSMNPIAIGYFGAVYQEKKYRLLLMISMFLGMYFSLPLVQAVKYGLIMVVIGISTGFVERLKHNLSPTIMGILCAVVTAAFSLSDLGTQSDLKTYFVLAILEGVLVMALVNLFFLCIRWFLHSSKGQPMGNEELISLAILAAAFVYGLPHVPLYNFSVMEMTSYLFVLFMGYKYGAGAGAISGATCGLVISLGSGSPNIIGIYCILGISAGMFRELGRFATGVAFLTINLAFGFFYENSFLQLPLVRGLISAIVVFYILPRSIADRAYFTEGGVENENGFAKQSLKIITKQKLGDFSESFQKLSKTFSSLSDTKETLNRQDIDEIVDHITKNLCGNCRQCGIYKENGEFNPHFVSTSVLKAAKHRGNILASDMPKGFEESCVNTDIFLEETNRELAVATLNLNWYNRMAESREAIAGQLGEVADIMKSFADELYEIKELEKGEGEILAALLRRNHMDVKKVAVLERRNNKQEIHITVRSKGGRCITTRETAALISKTFGKVMRPSRESKNIISKEYDRVIFVEDTKFKTLTGMARISKEGETVSGDNFSFLPLECGEMVMTLSDGMGTGPKACEESASVIELLEQFMEAGFSEKSAIRLINSILVLKSNRQSFSTLDMSVINLFNGMCDFIKIGASTTFIKRNNRVETIQSTTLPVGVLNQVEIEGVSKKLYDGDFIIMVTDGVMDTITHENPEEYIADLISNITSKNPQEIANRILKIVKEQKNESIADDVTIMVAGFWKK